MNFIIIKCEGKKNMKKSKILLILLLVACYICYVVMILSFVIPCPREGYYKNSKDSTQNVLKNRLPDTTSQTLHQITYKQILHDTKLHDSMYVCLKDVYILSATRMGPESCNCYTKVLDEGDYHIVVTDSLHHTHSKYKVIVETTRYSKILNVKQYLNKRVNIYGFIFHDHEHKGNSWQLTKSVTKKGVWRGNITEIHPVIRIEIVN